MEEKGATQGYAKFESESGIIFLKEILVQDTNRRNGIGTALMEEIERIPKKQTPGGICRS